MEQELPDIEHNLEDRATSVGAVLASSDISRQLAKTLPEKTNNHLYKQAIQLGLLMGFAVLIVIGIAIYLLN